jgi:hypothetical protein
MAPMSSATAEATRTPVTLGGVRGGPEVRHLRKDLWWGPPVATALVLLSATAYTVWAVFQNRDYFAGPSVGRDYLSPLFSPCVGSSCNSVHGASFIFTFHWWTITPGLLAILLPFGFRATCYYYRKAYYRAFWLSPPACAVSEPHRRYTGESRFPLIVQNVHRYFFYVLLIYNVLLSIDAAEAFRMGNGWGVGVGTLVLVVNAVLLWLYSASCHACRHACGGKLNHFSRHPVRYRAWKLISRLNTKHMQIAWASLIWVTFSDLYVRLVASGTIHDPRLF